MSTPVINQEQPVVISQPTTPPVVQPPVVQPPVVQPVVPQESLWERIKRWFSNNGWIVLLVLLLIVTIILIVYLIYSSQTKASMESDISELITISETNKSINDFKPKSNVTKDILKLFKKPDAVTMTTTPIARLPTPVKPTVPVKLTTTTATVGYQAPKAPNPFVGGGYHSLVSTPTSNY